MVIHQNFNRHDEFDARINEALGHYVYALFDPTTQQPFYVGKGGGREGPGNHRVLHHFDEARRSLNSDKPQSAKVAKIHEIWRDGRAVDWIILRHKLATEDEALTVESAIIDTLDLTHVALKNRQRGHGADTQGVLHLREVYSLGAPEFDPKDAPESLLERAIFIFPIQNNYRKQPKEVAQSEDSIFQATCRAWRVSQSNQELPNALAIGVVDFISYGVFGISKWQKDGSKRSSFESVPVAPQEKAALLNRNLRDIIKINLGYWRYGNYMIFKIANDRSVSLIRGAPKPRQP